MRFHWVLPDRAYAMEHYGKLDWDPHKHLWAYTRRDMAADACLRAVQTDLKGHEVFYIVAPDTAVRPPLARARGGGIPRRADPRQLRRAATAS